MIIIIISVIVVIATNFLCNLIFLLTALVQKSHFSTSSLEFDAFLNFFSHCMILGGINVDSPNATGITPLMNAALNASVLAVKSLIKRGVDPSLMDDRGWNSSHFATEGGDTDIIDLIHTHLPDIESKTGEGYTPLMVAALCGKL